MPSSDVESTVRVRGVSYEEFATFALPLYSGPRVTIRVGSTGCEFEVSKALLCKQSPYLAATFEGQFQEGKEQATTLKEIDGVVTVRSVQLLLQWLHTGTVEFGDPSPGDKISAALEFTRFADMCRVTGMETQMAEYIKNVIKDNLDLGLHRSANANSNTYHLTSNHIISGTQLPDHHPVRKMLAAAAVQECLKTTDHKFRKEVSDVNNFAADLLRELIDTLGSWKIDYGSVIVEDPISGIDIFLERRRSK